MFKNPGQKLQDWGHVFFWIEAVGALIGGIVLMFETTFWWGLLCILGGVAVAYFTALLIIAFGTLVENSEPAHDPLPPLVASAPQIPVGDKKPAPAKPVSNVAMATCPKCGTVQKKANRTCYVCYTDL